MPVEQRTITQIFLYFLLTIKNLYLRPFILKPELYLLLIEA